jgi:CheY-like chemotaxis protein
MRRILVVATNSEVRAKTARSLRELGYAVEARRAPDRAVARVARRRPAAIIVDAQLGSQSCSSFVEACRREVSAQDMPILVVAATPRAAIDMIRAGAQGCVKAPAEPANLAPMLSQVHVPAA